MPAQIVIIDTDVSFIVRLKQALEAHDFMVRTVGRPTVGLEELGMAEFDIALIDLTIDHIGELINTLRQYHPHLPIVLSGQSELDLNTITQYRAQGYIHKPYTARDLIPVIEQAMARGYWAQQHSQDATSLPEPPPDEEATIGEVLSTLVQTDNDLMQEESGGEDSQQPLPPDTLPEAVTGEPPLKSGDTPAIEALKLANNDEMVDSLLLNTQMYPTVRPLPSWKVPSTPQDIARVESIIGAPLTSTEEPPYSSITRPFAVPEIDILPEPDDSSEVQSQLDPELLEALADAEAGDDPHLQAMLSASFPPPETEELVAKSVDEITQAMGLPDTDEDLEQSPDAEAVDELLEEIDVVAHASLQLTQFSLESSALATLLMYNNYPAARTGTFSDETWDQIGQEVVSAWEREAKSNTRVLYRDLPHLGQVLIFSTTTVDDLILTMIFGADTSLKAIRQQTRRLTEALETVPETPPTAAEEEPAAARTTPSRPTDLKPPPDLKPEITPPRPKREVGVYMGYACLWLLENPDYSLNGELADGIKRWLQRTATTNDWDLIDIEIGESWINLHIEIPVKAIPGQVIRTLMDEIQTQLLAVRGVETPPSTSIWADSYSVTTPGRLLEFHEIERFIRFHHG